LDELGAVIDHPKNTFNDAAAGLAASSDKDQNPPQGIQTTSNQTFDSQPVRAIDDADQLFGLDKALSILFSCLVKNGYSHVIEKLIQVLKS